MIQLIMGVVGAVVLFGASQARESKFDHHIYNILSGSLVQDNISMAFLCLLFIQEQ